MIRRPPRSTHCISSAASDVYKRQLFFMLYLRFFYFFSFCCPPQPPLSLYSSQILTSEPNYYYKTTIYVFIESYQLSCFIHFETYIQIYRLLKINLNKFFFPCTLR
eukprot:TRINITY_DN8031_c0_g1_i1.p3 TRINITY_DN8031_c0_g1~~TRINITY_DN8031_c0_g1_i1.p3  ORF type:complete len:106 (-),score=18.32 TRINITY_DN8031_c0_g1_i1:192-509(-)